MKPENTTNTKSDRYMTEWITADEAAEYLKIPVRSLYYSIRTGQIPCHRLGRRQRFRRYELDQLMEKSLSAKSISETLNGMMANLG